MDSSIYIGSKAPHFSLKDENNDDFSLDKFKGQWVVLYFYPKDRTPGCTKQAKDFTYNLDKFKDLGAIVVGVSGDSISNHCTFIEKSKLNIKLLSDEAKEVSKIYNSKKEKTIFGKQFSVIRRNTFLIDPNGNVNYIWNDVKVLGHVEQVLKKIKEERFLIKVSTL